MIVMLAALSWLQFEGYSAAAVAQRVRSVHNHNWNVTSPHRVVTGCPTEAPVAQQLLCAFNPAVGDVRTEGQSYGMMLAAWHDDRAAFDALWAFAERHMRDERSGYFHWSVWLRSGAARSNTTAPDGEEWFAAALVLGFRRWGDPALLRAARTLLGDMLQPPAGCGVEPIMDAENHLPRLVPNPGPRANLTDPSYANAAFFELFARVRNTAPDRRARWAAAASAARSLVVRAADDATGLCPDYAHFDGTPAEPHPIFSYDSWRVGCWAALDTLWWGELATQGVLHRLTDFFGRRAPPDYGYAFFLNGTRLAGADYHQVGLVAMNACAAAGLRPRVSTPASRRLAADLMRAEPLNIPARYYDNMLLEIGLSVAAGLTHPQWR